MHRKLQVLEVFRPGKGPSVSLGEEPGWTSEPTRAFQRRNKSLSLDRLLTRATR